MPLASVNGIQLNYDDRRPLGLGASGEPVVFISGRGGAGRTWHLHQVPVFRSAGYRTITFDNRGIAPSSDGADGFTIDDMVADTAALIEHLDAGPARVVGVSMGAFITQELMLARPDLVSAGVLMATRGRDDLTRTFFRKAEDELAGSGLTLPAAWQAKMRMLESFSPRTLNNEAVARDWIDMFTMWPEKPTPGLRHQTNLIPGPDRLLAYRGITRPTLVMGFTDDVVLPPHLGREVADAIPGASYVEIPDTGHLGFIERPEVVNRAVLEFFAAT